jgi:hypothetical protein
MEVGEVGRAARTCIRCGRSGFNAFERVSVGADAGGWACTHTEPCSARRRSQWRADQRSQSGRPASSPLLGWSDEAHQSAVIGANPTAVESIEHLIRELTPLDVERLDVSPRSLTRLSRGTYSVVVVDADPSDPLAYCNELYRRLTSPGRRKVPVVICSPADQSPRPPIRQLVDRPNVTIVDRPTRPDDLVAAVSDAVRSHAADERVGAPLR